MKLYLIGGLGADERVFKKLKLDIATHYISWEMPQRNESLESYVFRLREQIDTSKKFSILGVSFGGIIALELSKIINPENIILISSVSKQQQLPTTLRFISKIGILNILPIHFIKPPKFILNFLFGAENKQLLENIIADTDPKFVKWALNALANWKNENQFNNVIRIHGSKDKLIPLKGEAIKVVDGGHFMIVDKAEEISKILNGYLK